MAKRDSPRPQPKDAKKSAKVDEARMRRAARRKLEKTVQSDTGRAVTAEMVTAALTKRSINQLDAATRNKSPQPPVRSWNQQNKNPPDSSLGMLPYKALKKHVAWLTPQQQDATAGTSLTAELLAFSKYVELDEQERGARQSMLLDIQDAVQSKFPSASISQFGSYPVGLSIFMSDIDISVDNVLSGHSVPALPSAPAEGQVVATGGAESGVETGNSKSGKRPLARDEGGVPVNKRIKFDEADATGDTGAQPLHDSADAEEPVTWVVDGGAGRGVSVTQDLAPVRAAAPAPKAPAARTGPVRMDDCFDDDFSEESSSSDGSDSEFMPSDYATDSEDGEEEEEESDFVNATSAEGAGEEELPDPETTAMDENLAAVLPARLPLDIDVPFWDGVSADASNAALHDTSGVLDDSLADGLYLLEDTPARAQRQAAEVSKKEKVEVLSKIFKAIKSMAWVRRAELRKHARVPIINLVHKNGVECDISLDMSQQDTSLVVRRLLQRCGDALRVLSAFLKVYLAQLALDAPFTGGLGSYKLYVLLAKHIEHNQQLIADRENPELGPLLLSFLKHYGTKQGLNKGTVVQVDGAEAVDFGATLRIEDIRRALERAHALLAKPVATSSQPEASQARAHSFLDNKISGSALACLLNTSCLCSQRADARQLCLKHPKRTEEERDEVARGVLREMNRRLQVSAGSAATLEEVKAENPALAARLRSFASVSSAVGHLAGLTDSQRSRDLQEAFRTPSALTDRATAPAVAEPTAEMNVTTQAALAPSHPAELGHAHLMVKLEAALPLVTLQRGSAAVRVFDPDSEEGKAIISGKRSIDRNLIFRSSKAVKMLRKEQQQDLQAFHCLALTDVYMQICQSGRAYEQRRPAELAAIQAEEEKAVQTVRSMAARFAQEQGGPGRAFLRRCYIAGYLPTPRKLQPPLTPAEISVREILIQNKIFLDKYVFAVSNGLIKERTEPAHLRSLVLSAKVEQQARTLKENLRRKDTGESANARPIVVPYAPAATGHAGNGENGQSNHENRKVEGSISAGSQANAIQTESVEALTNSGRPMPEGDRLALLTSLVESRRAEEQCRLAERQSRTEPDRREQIRERPTKAIRVSARGCGGGGGGGGREGESAQPAKKRRTGGGDAGSVVDLTGDFDAGAARAGHTRSTPQSSTAGSQPASTSHPEPPVPVPPQPADVPASCEPLEVPSLVKPAFGRRRTSLP